MRQQDAKRFGGRRRFMKTAGTAVTAGSIAIAGCAELTGGSSDELVFGIIPAEDNLDTIEQWEPVGQAIDEQVEPDIEYHTATDYTGVIEAMANDQVDIGWFGAFAYVLAHERAGAEAIAWEIDAESGEPGYYSYLVTHDTSIDSISEMAGLDAAFVDPASTSGFLIPTAMMLQEGLHPEEDFNELQYSGDHNAGVLQVQEENVDVAPVASQYWRNLESQGEIDPPNDVHVAVESDLIPREPIAVHPDLDDNIRESLTDALLSFEDDDTFDTLGMSGWEETDDAAYDGIRDIQNELNEEGFEVGA